MVIIWWETFGNAYKLRMSACFLNYPSPIVLDDAMSYPDNWEWHV